MRADELNDLSSRRRSGRSGHFDRVALSFEHQQFAADRDIELRRSAAREPECPVFPTAGRPLFAAERAARRLRWPDESAPFDRRYLTFSFRICSVKLLISSASAVNPLVQLFLHVGTRSCRLLMSCVSATPLPIARFGRVAARVVHDFWIELKNPVSELLKSSVSESSLSTFPALGRFASERRRSRYRRVRRPTAPARTCRLAGRCCRPDAQAEDQIPLLLNAGRNKVRLLAHVAGRVGVGNIIAHHLQADLHRLQRVASHLNGAEKTHAPPTAKEECCAGGTLGEHKIEPL